VACAEQTDRLEPALRLLVDVAISTKKRLPE